jgi:hypothetical protein
MGGGVPGTTLGWVEARWFVCKDEEKAKNQSVSSKLSHGFISMRNYTESPVVLLSAYR